jgi:hypothetical protein
MRAFSSESHPGVTADIPPATSGFVLNHSMLRVKDPAVSLAFYSHVLGMRVLRKLDFPEMKFSLYFLAKLDGGEDVPTNAGSVQHGRSASEEFWNLLITGGPKRIQTSNITMEMPSHRDSGIFASPCRIWLPLCVGSTRTRFPL